MKKDSAFIALNALFPSAPRDVYVGPAGFDRMSDGLYGERRVKIGNTVIWSPRCRKTVCLASYYDAQDRKDEAALATLAAMGVPLGLDFGVGRDLSDTYAVVEPKPDRPARKPVVKVCRAKFAAAYEDGRQFKRGTVVKIRFRAKYVETVGGTKTFQNVYEKPTAEELAEFFASERAGK